MVDVLMIGTGEYTTGYGADAEKSDKSAGVVGLTMFDLRKRGFVKDIGLCGTNGGKFPAIREHMGRAIGESYPKSDFDLSMRTFPADGVRNVEAYEEAVKEFPAGSAVTIFTPDDTHFRIALACIEAGHHVLVTKPPVLTLEEHRVLADAAARKGVFVMVEVHKRFDPLYQDARDKLATYGDLSFFTSFMSQPKYQLETFRGWAGKSSTNISLYLNSHHVDFCDWVFEGRARPIRVVAMAATGVADRVLGLEKKEDSSAGLEDTITLMVQWENVESGALGIGTFTSSWIAPRSDVHSQQRFYVMCHTGEVTIDQAHRGYSTATDTGGFASVNPLFMRYTPSKGKFVGQDGYGYRSIEAFVRACADLNAGKTTLEELNASDLASIQTTHKATAVLEAGNKSLENDGRAVHILYDDETSRFTPTGFREE